METTKNSFLIKLASYLSVFTAIVILIVKTYGWLLTDSQSMFASVIDSLLDVSSSLINIVAITFALQPPDKNHRFGHEKFQDLAIFSQSIFFFASSIFTLFSSFKGIYNKSLILNSSLGIDMMYLCLILTTLLVILQTYVIKKTHSKIIEVDRIHYFSDFLTNIVVVISIYCSSKFWFIDSLAGIGISLYVMHASYSLFRQAIKNLADEEFEDHERQIIIDIVRSHKKIKGIHELKTRHAANKPFIQFHLEMDGNTSLLDAHALSDEICLEIIKHFEGGEITVHLDPEGVEEHTTSHDSIKF